jgi:hypothetical protein
MDQHGRFVYKETVWNFAVGCVVGLHGKMLQDRFVRKRSSLQLGMQLSLKDRNDVVRNKHSS